MLRLTGSFVICIVSLVGISHFVMVRSEQQTQITDQEVIQLMEKRSKVVGTLLSIAKRELKSNPIKAAWAIEKLGELKAREAIDFLVNNITFQSPYVDEPSDLYPAVVALQLIGYPSVEEIVWRSFEQERSDMEQKLMADVIRGVLGRGYPNSWESGTRIGRLIIQEHIRFTNFPSPIRERLVKFMEKYFPEKKPTKHR